MINKRYKDLLEEYIYKGEPTPFTLGVLVICALCFLILIVSIFTQLNFSHFWMVRDPMGGFVSTVKHVSYNPQIPAMFLVLYILGRNYSVLIFGLYLLIGLFVCPIFAFGGGVEYVQNYFFGYMLGFLAAIFVSGKIIQGNCSLKNRMIAALAGILTIHLCAFIYCIILALSRIIDFSLIVPIVVVLSFSKIFYDILFSAIVMLLAPYIKNVLWVCMMPTHRAHKKSKNVRIRHQIVSDDAD